MNDPSAAIEAFERAIAIREELIGGDPHPGPLGSMYVVLSQMYQGQGAFVPAADAALRGAELLERDGRDAARTGDAFYMHAISLMRAGIEEGQAESYRRAIEFFDQTTHPNFEFLGVAAFNLGNYHQRRGEFRDAAPYFRRAAEAYGYMVRFLEAQETRQPGSVPPSVRRSFQERLQDAQHRIAQVEVAARDSSAAPKENPAAGLDVSALRGEADTPLSRFIRYVLNPTMDDTGETVTMENRDLTLTFEPDMIYTLTDRRNGSVEHGRNGFKMDFAISEGEVYLLEVDPDTMTREEFLEESDYLNVAETVLAVVDASANSVVFEYRKPQSLAGEQLALDLVGAER